MTLIPEQIAKGWKLHDGSDVCPIKDDRTVHQVMDENGWISPPETEASEWEWGNKIAYRIIEAHGADAEPARPTPFPADYSELVFDDAGWSQTIIVDGKRPEWLRDDDWCSLFCRTATPFPASKLGITDLAIRVRRREPKRETVRWTTVTPKTARLVRLSVDIVDDEPDLSTLKIAEGAL